METTEKKIAKIKGKFKFTVGKIPDECGAYIVCIYSRTRKGAYFDMAEWIGDLWEVPSHRYGSELYSGETVIGYAPILTPEITYEE